MPFLSQGLCYALPQGTHRAFPKPYPLTPAPPQLPASLCPSRRFCGPRPEARASPHPPPAPCPGTAFLGDEVSVQCRRAGRCPAKYRHQARPAWDRIWRRGGGGADLCPL